MAVVEPAARVVLDEAGRDVSFGPNAGLSMNAPAGSFQRWPWMWNVWKLESMPNTWISTSSPTRARSVGVLPAYARPLMHWNVRSQAA